MKIIYPHITQNLGGVEKRFFSYFQYILNREDNEYTILISRSFLKAIKQDLVSSNKKHTVIKYGFPWSKKGRFTRYIDYVSLIFVLLWLRTKRFDVVHFNTSASRMFRQWFNTKVRVISAVTSPKDWLESEISSPRFIEMISSGFGIDCLDTNIQFTIQSRFPKHSSNIFVTPCSFIALRLSENKEEAKEHAISFAGRLIPEKGANLLLEVLPEIIQKTSYKVYILGNGSLKSNFEKIISDNNWGQRVILTYDECPTRYMMKTEVFLSLQRDENYPSQSLLEAMYCKNAIVATNVGLTYKLVTPVNGILITGLNELIKAIKRLEDNKGDCAHMGINSNSIVMNQHNIETFNDYLLSLYSKMNNMCILSLLLLDHLSQFLFL